MTYLEGVYWDLDGTIANTELEAHLPAFNNAFKDLGIDWNWGTNTYIKLLKINGGKNRIAYYAKSNNDNFSEDLILKIHQIKLRIHLLCKNVVWFHKLSIFYFFCPDSYTNRLLLSLNLLMRYLLY